MKIYQIAIEDKPSAFSRITGELWESYKRLPMAKKAATTLVAATAAAPVAAAAVPEAAALATGAAAAGVVIVAKTAIDYLVGSGVSVEQIRTTEELNSFTEYRGAPWCGNGTFYIEHPKRPGLLVLAAGFHRAMADEQMADLLAFYRSEYPVRAISICMENRHFGYAGGSFSNTGGDGTGAGKGGPFSGKAKVSNELWN